MEQKIRDSEVWIAEVSDMVVGWAAFHGDYLGGLYTDPKYVHRGVGTALLALVENFMRDRGVQVVRLEASSNAETFYLRHGYVPTEPCTPTNKARPLMKRLV